MDKHEFCIIHQNEKIQMYCSNCHKTVCLKCISGPHLGHRFRTIDDVVHGKRDQLQKSMATMEDTITTFNTALNSVNTNHEDYSREIQTLTNRVISNREEWKKQIDEIADMVLVQMKKIADEDFEELKKRKADLSKTLTELQEILDSLKDTLNSADDLPITQLAADFKEKEKSQNSCPILTALCPPHFVSDIIDISHLRETFGRMVRDEEAASDFVGYVNQEDNIPVKTGNATSVSTIDTSVKLSVTPHIDTLTIATINTPAGIQHADCMSTVGENKAWVGRGHNKVIALVNKDSQVLQKVDLEFSPRHITTTNTGEVVVTDKDNLQVKTYTADGEYMNTIMNTSPYQPHGLCTTSDNDILICLHQSDTNNKVTRVTTTGQVKQTLQYSKPNTRLYLTKKNLFTFPVLVKENINKDVCVVDGNTTLVVVNNDGALRYRYPDKSTHNTSIKCYGIVCDRVGHILLSDYWNNCIHLIDMNGQFVQCILDQEHGIKYPHELSINNKGELWVCNKDGCEVRVIKYYS